MAGRPLVISWADADTAEALQERYRKERDGEVRSRVQALWLLRRGWRLQAAAEAVGVHYRTVQRWIGWYRDGGLQEVCVRRGGGYGQVSRLTPEQEAALVEEAGRGSFATAEAARQWVARQFGVTYTPSGISRVLYRLRCGPKVPRPVHVKADREAQAAWKKGAAPQRSRRQG